MSASDMCKTRGTRRARTMVTAIALCAAAMACTTAPALAGDTTEASADTATFAMEQTRAPADGARNGPPRVCVAVWDGSAGSTLGPGCTVIYVVHGCHPTPNPLPMQCTVDGIVTPKP